jgi:hypothetical protein
VSRSLRESGLCTHPPHTVTPHSFEPWFHPDKLGSWVRLFSLSTSCPSPSSSIFPSF